MILETSVTQGRMYLHSNNVVLLKSKMGLCFLGRSSQLAKEQPMLHRLQHLESPMLGHHLRSERGCKWKGAMGWYFEKRNIRTVNKYVILIWFTVWYHSTIRCWFLWHWHEHKNLRGRLFVHMAWNPAVSAIFYAPLSNSKKNQTETADSKRNCHQIKLLTHMM